MPINQGCVQIPRYQGKLRTREGVWTKKATELIRLFARMGPLTARDCMIRWGATPVAARGRLEQAVAAGVLIKIDEQTYQLADGVEPPQRRVAATDARGPGVQALALALIKANGGEATIGQAMQAWGISYGGARYRMRTLVKAGLADLVGVETFRLKEDTHD